MKNGEEMSEIKEFEKLPSFQRRRRLPELEVGDEGIFRQV